MIRHFQFAGFLHNPGLKYTQFNRKFKQSEEIEPHGIYENILQNMKIHIYQLLNPGNIEWKENIIVKYLKKNR